MKDQLRELERKAMQEVLGGPDLDGDIGRMYIPDEFVRVFARLVAKSCADLARQPIASKMSATDIANLIELSF